MNRGYRRIMCRELVVGRIRRRRVSLGRIRVMMREGMMGEGMRGGNESMVESRGRKDTRKEGEMMR